MAEQAAHNRLVEGLLGKKPSTGESFRAHYLTSRSQRGGNVTPNQVSLKRNILLPFAQNAGVRWCLEPRKRDQARGSNFGVARIIRTVVEYSHMFQQVQRI